MNKFYTLEAQVRDEWNAVRVFMALHPYWSMLILFAVGNIIGVVAHV